MSINVRKLVDEWIKNFGEHEIETCERYGYYPIYNGLWAFYENGLMTEEKLKRECQRLSKAFNIYSTNI